ncbi:MAG: ATP-binding protein [Desulfurivibrionaceae bacterium]
MLNWFVARRWRIILAGIMLVVTPTVFLAVFVVQEIQSHISGMVMDNNLQIARFVAGRIKERLAGETAFSMAYAARPYLVEGLQRGDKRELDKHLKNLIENAPNIERAFITSQAGIQLAAFPEDPATLGKDFSHRDWYLGVARNWQPYVSEFYLRDARPQRLLFAIAVPIKDKDDKVFGILVMQPKDDYLATLMPQIAGNGRHAYVVDGRGRLIFHSELKMAEALVDFSTRPGVQRLLRGEEGTEIIFCDIHKEQEIIAYAKVEKVGWGVVLYDSRYAALAPFRRLAYGIIGFAGFMLLLGGFSAYKGADLFAGSARLNRELAEKEATEKAYGDFLALLNLSWSGLEELGQAALRKLCEATCAEAGVFYLGLEGQVVPYAALGVSKPLQSDGLAQACLDQGKTVKLVEIAPESHLILHAGVGSFSPKEILVVPLEYQGKAIGVLELACIHGLGDMDRQIIQRIAPRLGVAVQILADNLEKARISEELAKANEEYQAANEELKAQQQELTLLNQRLAEASRTKSDFLANMSHELRTPLNSILGFSQVLQEQMFGNLNEKQQEYVSYILGSGRHLLELINEILDLAKVEAGKMILEINRFTLKTLLDAAMIMFKEKALKHGVSLELDLDSALNETIIEADARKLKQILFNLLSNALKFTSDGGSVRLSAEQEGDFFRVTVADTGIGISQENIGRLFQSFAQLESPYAKKYEGTGLGLALTRKLVELHGGRIWVESEEGKGSSFIFTIPVRQPGQAQSAPEQAVRRRGGAREKTALIIEDDQDASRIVEAALVGEGFVVRSAVNGREGVAAAQENPPGLIILDLMLPEMNGFEVLGALRSRENTTEVPVIILTAMELPGEERGRLLRHGAQAVLEKGRLDREEFIAVVDRVTG